ncbi:MAG: RNase adapter RapZ [Zoogloeaceae bacterium]|jgi:UPF0042 nucleotide-binding protein|nr:RNase adapter RapZ [Zoogloeaceae bacterium]
MKIVLISGLSGSGKSVALRSLEDRGYYCVDNLPTSMLEQLVAFLETEQYEFLAVAIDARSSSIAALPEKSAALRRAGHQLVFLFLEAQDYVLIQRFSETRRRHPLADGPRTLQEAIREERHLLSPLAEFGQRLDTSGLPSATLREWVLQSACAGTIGGLTLLIESFGFKYGLPRDADLVFDARCLPNPYYEPALSAFSGLDAPVAAFLEGKPAVKKMREDIRRFIADWLPDWRIEGRSYLTVAIGCTGGQHRSVYLADWLGKAFSGEATRVLVRHRTLAMRQGMEPPAVPQPIKT